MKELNVLGGGAGISRTSHGALMSPAATFRTAFGSSALMSGPPFRDIARRKTTGCQAHRRRLNAQANRVPVWTDARNGWDRAKRSGDATLGIAPHGACLR